MSSPPAPTSSSPSSSLSTNRRALQSALEGAKRVLKRRFRVLLLVRDAYELEAEEAHTIRRVRSDLTTLLRLLKAWALRQYQRVPWPSLLLVASAVVYFVMPADLVPDVLPMVGFVDDIAVVSAVVQAVRGELNRFRAWERASSEGAATTSPPLAPKRAA